MSKPLQHEVASGTAHPLLARRYRIWLVVPLIQWWEGAAH